MHQQPSSPSVDESLRQRYEAELAQSQILRGQLQSSRESAGTLERYAVEADQSLRRAREHIEKLRALHRVSLRLHATLEPARIWTEAVDLLERLVTSTSIAAYAVNRNGTVSRSVLQGVPLLDLPTEVTQAPDVLAWALRADNAGSLASPDGRFLAVPVITERRVVGAFALVRRKGEKFDAHDTELVEMVGLITAQGMEGASRYRAMEEEALSDALTGVANYRYFRRQIDLEVARAQRFRYPLGLLIADLDHFKKINDQYGHPAGDQALARTAQAMRLAVRRSDVLARVGGEEFAVILPSCDLQQARIVGEKVRMAVRAANGTSGSNKTEHIPLTVSVGGTAMAGAMISAQELIERADSALLQAKRSGRDQTIILAQSTADRSATSSPPP
ncbi:MAG: diguanylate cyclase [Chloroflexota bacterium]